MTGGAKAEKLFEDVILASAAILGAFPPVLIEVELDEQTYREVHVDGGLSRQIFFYNDVMACDGDWTSCDAKSNMYVITNGEFYPQWKTIELALVYLVRRSIATLLKYQVRIDVLRIYDEASKSENNFNFSFVDELLSQALAHDKIFDTELMKNLHHHGYTLMLADMLWHKKPPGFNTSTPEKDLRFSQGVLD